MPVTPNSNKPDDDIPHPRSHSVSGMQPTDSPSHQVKTEKSYNLTSSSNTNPTDMQLKYENDRLKLALAQRYVFFNRRRKGEDYLLDGNCLVLAGTMFMCNVCI